MEIGRVCKYCHVSAYVAYDNCDPVYKQTFKFEILPGEHNSLVWDKIIKIFKKNGYKVELKSRKEFYLLFYYIYLFFLVYSSIKPKQMRENGKYLNMRVKVMPLYLERFKEQTNFHLFYLQRINVKK